MPIARRTAALVGLAGVPLVGAALVGVALVLLLAGPRIAARPAPG